MFCTDLPPIPTVLAPCLQPPLLAPRDSSAGFLPPRAPSFQLCSEHLGRSCSHPVLQDTTPSSAVYCPSPSCSQTSVFSLPPTLPKVTSHSSTPVSLSSPFQALFHITQHMVAPLRKHCPTTPSCFHVPMSTLADEGWWERLSWQQSQHKVTAWTHLKPGSCLSCLFHLLYLCSWGCCILTTSYWDYWCFCLLNIYSIKSYPIANLKLKMLNDLSGW